MIILKILTAWLAADFISGVVHWFEDHILDGSFKSRILAEIHIDNQFHHRRPSLMLENSLWGNINTSAPYAWTASAILYLCGVPLILWLSVFFVSFVNITHRWAHTPRVKLHPVIQFLQWTGLFISMRQHGEHHIVDRRLAEKENSERRYCAMTSWLNPVLDRIGFFSALEYLWRRK